ncbi:MAG: bifunctional methylenetetrahydrofolate dehydrogenase/methenyltetrahydrofolate cyclohydrolase FolD [Oscillospiraceae bacterium]|jgi:methylenetetrahydrofolate dehydrogenase (NADP+)/methenyltetrahydrofolate cyclohydrolase|nr:bifunctional methylenetetrahydrofolate dehydrogenase/methenyltetrahydrofolate cyclohydrolase FolD [Oscillospiraceae bacterium]
MSNLLNGKDVSAKILARVAEQTRAHLAAGGAVPTLAVILVGEDPASQIYVRNKHRTCEAMGFRSLEYTLPADAGQAALLARIEALNADASVHGILCQMPLPKGFDYDDAAVQQAVLPGKDVDVFHPMNAGYLSLGTPRFLPGTPAGVMELLADAGIPLAGKHVVVLGRSNIVGKPMALLALMADATVTICHSKTQNLGEITRQADILIAAVGRPRFVTADMVKEGAVVIDVGVNRLEGKKVCGDVDFDAVAPKASWITPVPGGCGPMTIAMLMQNTLKAATALGALAAEGQ